MLHNAPSVKVGVVAVSRDCFPIALARKRLEALACSCENVVMDMVLRTIIENENDAITASRELTIAGCNAAVVYLGNFGPEGPLAIFAKQFNGPVMVCAAAEESGDNLVNGRGDAFCGLLNASYNFNLRNIKVHIPQNPVGLPEHLAEEIKYFEKLAGVLLGLAELKIFSFGPRPQDFYACNAPIAQLYKLGIEVMENSELDLLLLYQNIAADDSEVLSVIKDMKLELGCCEYYEDLLPKLARYEVALARFMQENMGSRKFGIFANKCWPSFEKAFGFVPCYVNSRLASRGIPVACEVDIYGALSEYICYLASQNPPTLLDINNTVPDDMACVISDMKGALRPDLFMGFHCGNTPKCHMKNCSMKYQLIMNRLMEDADKLPDITRGTFEGQIAPGPVTLFRLQGGLEGGLHAYIAEGHILDVDPKSFGGIGVFAIPGFSRFYRHVLVGKHFPHHGAVAFAHTGQLAFDALKMMGVTDINYPLPESVLYPMENPWAVK